MNGIRCPQCSLVNPTSALQCGQCQFPFSNVPKSAYVSVPATDYEKNAAYHYPPPAPPRPAIDPDNSTGGSVHLFYRLYCGFMVFIYLAVAGMGIFMMSMYASMPELSRGKDGPVMKFVGVAYLIMGIALAVPYLLGIFFPRKSWNWIYGIVMIGIGMTSICFLPFLIPLLIYWIKPETQAYFGRPAKN